MRIQANELIDSKYGFDRYKDPADRLGWLINMHPVSKTKSPYYWTFVYIGPLHGAKCKIKKNNVLLTGISAILYTQRA